MRRMWTLSAMLALAVAAPGRADEQRLAPGTGTQDAVVISTGANGLCETTASNGDIQAAEVGSGTPSLNEIRCGPNEIAESVAAGDDVQVIAVGATCRNPNNAIVDTGPNGIAETPLVGDDNYFAGMSLGAPPAQTACVITGANGIADTAARSGDDVQLLAAGQAEANTNVIRCGPNRVADTTANNVEAGDDVQRLPKSSLCASNDVVVDSGPDGIATTRAEGSDLRLNTVKPVKLTIKRGQERASKVVKVTVENVEFGDAAPDARPFRLRATRGSCPAATVMQLDADAKTKGLQATADVRRGKKAKASFTVEARLDTVTVVDKKVPFRCTFTVSAVALETDPDFDDAVNDENNTATVQLEVVDLNDL
ncbi:MAG TPA: hypothetical protein VNO26_12960 [Candidatus Limnocylindria bacterium]|nr:hypothetical protein [Candidatus Limnocylindria bacterium]